MDINNIQIKRGLRIWVLLVLLVLLSCDTRKDRHSDKTNGSGVVNSLIYPGKVPLFGCSLWSKDEEIKSTMKLIHSSFINRATQNLNISDNLRWPLYRCVSSLNFSGGVIGGMEIDKTHWQVTEFSVISVDLAVKSLPNNFVQSLSDYQQICDILTDSLGEPIWTNMFKDRLFRDSSYNDRERAFFAEQADMYLHWRGNPLPLSRSIIKGQGSSGRETIPSLRMWRWSDSGTTWCVVAYVSSETKAGANGGEYTLYSIKIELIPMPETDLRKINSDLAEREKEYAGWVFLGSDVLPGDHMSLCEGVPDSVWNFLRQNHLPLGSASSDKIWYVYSGSSPGLMQVRYASDTADGGLRDPLMKTTRGGRFFIRCRGVVFDTAVTGYDRPILYVNTVSEVRDANNPDCP